METLTVLKSDADRLAQIVNVALENDPRATITIKSAGDKISIAISAPDARLIRRKLIEQKLAELPDDEWSFAPILK